MFVENDFYFSTMRTVEWCYVRFLGLLFYSNLSNGRIVSKQKF